MSRSLLDGADGRWAMDMAEMFPLYVSPVIFPPGLKERSADVIGCDNIPIQPKLVLNFP